MLSSVLKSLTANEAASVTGVPLKQVHRIIDAGFMQDYARNERGSRVVALDALVTLRLLYLTAHALTHSARQTIAAKILAGKSGTIVEEAPLQVDLQPVIMEVEAGLDRLEKARQAVQSDPAVLGGEPVFSGTRVSVHDIADMIGAGDTVDAIAAGYPQLTLEQISLASDYAIAYPRRGRPKGKPTWRASGPKSSRTLKLKDLPGLS